MFKEIDYKKHFVIGTPLVGWKSDKKEDRAWMENAQSVIEKFPNVKFFAALELDHRGLEPFSHIIEKLKSFNGEYWTYSINDMESKVTYSNRWIRIETGRNLIREFAQRNRKTYGNNWGEDASKVNRDSVQNEAVLYVDSDMIVNVPIIEKLFEIDRPLVSVNVPAYGLGGKVVNEVPRIEEHWNTAGMLLVNSPAFYDLPWFHNNLLNLSDDPSFQSLAERLKKREGIHNLEETYGMTWVRKDINADHKGQLLPVESRQIPDRMI
jgi:hypothetical protein